MDLASLLIIVLLAIGLVTETFLLIGAMKILRSLQRKIYILLANYKSDLEMVLLHSHEFDDFIKATEQAMQADDSEKAKHSGIG